MDFRKLRRLTLRADWIGIWWTVLGPGGVLWAALSMIFAWFTPIAEHGWAAVVLAAFASALSAWLIFAIGFLAFAVAWRAFRPFPKTTEEPSADNKQPIPSYESMKERVEALEEHSKTNTQILNGLSDRMDSIAPKIEDEKQAAIDAALIQFETIYSRLDNRIDALASQLNDIDNRAKSEYKQIIIRDEMLRNAILARDALAAIARHDPTICDIGQRLLDASPGTYRNETDWQNERSVWEQAITEINDLFIQWFPKDEPILQIDHKEYEGADLPDPPDGGVVTKARNITRYRGLFIARTRYLRKRLHLRTFFKQKAHELP